MFRSRGGHEPRFGGLCRFVCVAPTDAVHSLSLPPWPMTPSPLVLFSSSPVHPVPSRSIHQPVLPPCLSGKSPKEMGQGSPYSCQRLVKQPKRRKRGACTSWQVDDVAREVGERNMQHLWCCAYKPAQTYKLKFMPISI